MNLKIKRLDHHGIVSGVIEDLKIVSLLDQYLPQDDKQEITPGEAVKGMIMNGLGFANRPLSLSPQFFTNLPLEHLFREGVQASHFNRHKLGRTLDQCFEFGCESLFSLVSGQACEIEHVDKTFESLDTTSHSLTGEYAFDGEDSDENVIHITHGYSKAHRPDLKQVVQEIIVSQDGGIPLACKNWDGNSADTAIFKARSKALVDEFKKSQAPKYLVADCKLYHKSNAEFLAQIQFLTLVPSTISLEKSSISTAIATNQWINIDDNGSGIEDSQKETVFSPFTRIETSRNKQTGGMGLGLAIAKNICNFAGISMTLTDSPLGGARFSLCFPIQEVKGDE